VLRRQLARAKQGRVWLSSVCDPYQPLEKKYKLTRQCLTLLAEAQFPVTVQTKFTLVLRDLDILARFRDIEAGLTITTEDETISRIFEPGASPVKERIAALAELHGRGIPTFVFIGPLLPGDPEKLFAWLAGNVDRVLVDRMNYLETIIGLYRKHGLTAAATDRFFREQARKLARLAERHGLPCDILF
jgi:DNA repair photolyase